jgi:phosphomannomutase
LFSDLKKKYSDGAADELDGITVQYKDWWFNVRRSNTEPLVRLNLEANTEAMRDQKLTELRVLLGDPIQGGH